MTPGTVVFTINYAMLWISSAGSAEGRVRNLSYGESLLVVSEKVFHSATHLPMVRVLSSDGKTGFVYTTNLSPRSK